MFRVFTQVKEVEEEGNDDHVGSGLENSEFGGRMVAIK